ncbi:chemotaxis protein [Cupriavidus consociatus]|uniref:chemotaxis protein n=1 Tax=Cupriavidus consociatus TaxID=2821357 RepID=UPI001AE8E1F3|nr:MULTISPECIES: chemotaxis protein [unclassified Cupriavidus]MBP0622905.1 chemotaxis protein [Cupriavidus sp. LEh25]MDK2659593.1 chemotaxis protein [Cupriavidus sp. LEh21]
MPLPLIIGAAALVTAAYGAKKGYDGYQKHSEADEIVKDAKARYERKKSAVDTQEEKTTLALDLLGKKELEIGKSIGEFKTLADKLLQQLNAGRENKLNISIPKHELQKIENYSYTAVSVLGTAVGAGAAGAAVGFAVYGGVMALGAASTGTAISALSGVAATNATLAALGGGALSAGGLGMAGGTAILGAAVAAPVLAIAGWAYNSHGEEALKNARKANDEVTRAVEKLMKASEQLAKTEDYARNIRGELTKIFGQFQQYFDTLKGINSFIEDIKGRNVDVEAEVEKLGHDILRVIENGFALAAILVNLIIVPIFRPTKINGKVMHNKDGVPEMEKDADGSMILNDTELDLALRQAASKAESIETARP